jgi:hypothetical protein
VTPKSGHDNNGDDADEREKQRRLNHALATLVVNMTAVPEIAIHP